jgi:chitinase
MIPLPRRRVSIATGLLAAALAAPVAARAQDKVFVGYLYGPTAGVDYALYTHVCHAFVTADADGRVRPNDRVPSRDVAAAAHKAGCRVLLSLGGWGWDQQFAAIVKSPEAEDRYVEEVLRLVDEFDYDGLDVDWEYPDTKEEVPGFERLSTRLRAGLDEIGRRKGRRMELTMAVAANPGTLRWLRPEFMTATYDWLNVMTYDMAGDWTSYAGHNAPLHPSSRQPEGAPLSVETTFASLLNDQKYPPEKLALGIPLYGRGFPVGEPYASKKDAPKRRLPGGDYKSLARLAADGWTRVWDDETQVPWLIAPDGSAVFGYDDAESAALKARFARQKGLRGVFFWEIQADRMPDGSTPLQAAARAALFE